MKDPAFLFYSSDFLNGVADLTMEERGQYISLLCLQHQKGAISEKTIRLSVGSCSEDVLKKFSKDENGNFLNKRLCEEIEKRKNFTESRRSNGSLGGRPIKGKPKDNLKETDRLLLGKPKDNLMEDVNENENENKDVFINIKETENGEISLSPDNEYLWVNIKSSFFNDFRWVEKFCRDKNLTQDKLQILMQEFLSDIELKEDYKELKELKSHFTNWYNLKNKANGTSKNNGAAKLGTSDARIAAIRNW